MILPKIIKETLGEDVYKQISDVCNESSHERKWVIWGSKAAIDAVEKAIEEEFKINIKYETI